MRTTRSIKQTRDDLAERRAAAAQRVREQIDLLRTAATLRRHEDAVAALEQVLARGRLVFASLADLLLPQVWATNAQGALLDHLLVVDDATYAQALDADEYNVWSLADALAQPWADLDVQAGWVAIYVELLEGERDAAQKRLDAALWRRGLLEVVTHDKKIPP